MRAVPLENLPLNVLLIVVSTTRARLFKEGLGPAKITQTTSSNPADLSKTIAQLKPDVIIMDCENPDITIINNLKTATADNPTPIVMFVEGRDGSLAKEAVRSGISAYIVDGLLSGRVQPVVEIAIERFNILKNLHSELEKSKENLEARKVIERAKGLLMEKQGISESEAFISMRKLAMTESITIKDVADKILSVASILGDNF